MIFQPPVEEMIKKVGNCYALSNLMSARAKQIFMNRIDSNRTFEEKELQIAAEEIYEGKIVSNKVFKQN